MTTESIKSIPGVQAVLEGQLPGPEIVILAGVHGNETCGIRAMEELLPQLSIDRGRTTFVLGNFRAIEKNVRFIEQNLNRLFRSDANLSEVQKASYEYARSRELMPLLSRADLLLDIHSSGTPDTTPFVICDQRDIAQASRLPFSLISYGWDALEPGGTDDFVTSSGGRGICIECGYHDDPEAVIRAKDSIITFLAEAGVITQKPPFGAPSPQREIKVSDIHKTHRNFAPARYFHDFEPIKVGTLLGTDGDTEVLAPYDGVIIFSRTRIGSGEEAFILGKE